MGIRTAVTGIDREDRSFGVVGATEQSLQLKFNQIRF